jgi:hypothetical protein
MSFYTHPGIASASNAYPNRILQKLEDTSFTGIFCLYTPIVFTYFCVASMAFYEVMSVYLNIMITAGLLFRVIVFNWVGNIAHKEKLQKRNWKLLSLLVPAISLILIGYRKKMNRRNSMQTISTMQHLMVAQAKKARYIPNNQLQRKIS